MSEETKIEHVPTPTLELPEPGPYLAEESAPPPPDLNRLAAIEQAGPDAELVECPECGVARAKFVIIDGQCDACRTRSQAAGIIVTIGWPEVRQRRDIFLQRTDWTQLPDVPEATSSQFAAVRQELRDITNFPTPLDAWYDLDRIESTAL